MVNWWWENADWTLPEIAVEDFFFFFHLYAQTVVDWRLKFWRMLSCGIERFGMLWTRSGVALVRGFPFVRKERTLLSDVRNHHQPSYALLFSDVTLFPIQFYWSIRVKKRGILNKKENKRAVSGTGAVFVSTGLRWCWIWISKALDLWCGKGTRLSVRLYQPRLTNSEE